MHIRLSEHKICKLFPVTNSEERLDNNKGVICFPEQAFAQFQNLQTKIFNDSSNCFVFQKAADGFTIQADYCIGIDWLGQTANTIYVEPKLNSASNQHFIKGLDMVEEDIPSLINNSEENSIGEQSKPIEVNYLKMLLDVMSFPNSAKEAVNLVKIDWEAKRISIEQRDDKLTPFLIIKFLQLVKAIVRKGLKKSYYKKQENLTNRIKGKILVGSNIKQNVLKNKFTSTCCEYQAFGEDNPENRFIKKVLHFASSYIENNKQLFANIRQEINNTVNYCRPAFEHIGDEIEEYQLKHFKANSFFAEYTDAIKTGQYILKRFSYNITATSLQKTDTPPFWIDMPRLFELYFYCLLLKANPGDEKYIHYQFSTYGNALDVLITKPGFEMVIDAKYKLHYQNGQVHADIRQVAGYARLNKVLEAFDGFDSDKTLPCLIIYPDLSTTETPSLKLENLINKADESRKIKAYHKVFKLGIALPLIS